MNAKRTAVLLLLVVASSSASLAVEGGSGAYLLGSRDLMAGYVPPPGQYQTTDLIYITGSVDRLAIGGVAVPPVEFERQQKTSAEGV